MNTKRKIISAVAGIVLGTALLVTTAILAEESLITPIAAVALTSVSFAALLAAVVFAAKVDYETGSYQCRKCGTTFKPTFREYVLAPHTLTTRYLRCNKCKEKSWCKRKFMKNNDNN